MPATVTNTAGGNSIYPSPFVGPVNHTHHIKVDISGLTLNEVDKYGYLKPGVPLTTAGVLCGTSTYVYGVTVEAVKLPITIPADNTTLAAETNDCLVAIGTNCIVNRDVAEDILERAYTANELAAFIAAGSHVALTTT